MPPAGGRSRAAAPGDQGRSGPGRVIARDACHCRAIGGEPRPPERGDRRARVRPSPGRCRAFARLAGPRAGFRPGKVPRKVLEARMGGPARCAPRHCGSHCRTSTPGLVDTESIRLPSPRSISRAARTAARCRSTPSCRCVRSWIPGYDGLSGHLARVIVNDETWSGRSTGCGGTTPSSASWTARYRRRPGDHRLHGNDADGRRGGRRRRLPLRGRQWLTVPELDAELHGAKAGAILAFAAPNPTPGGVVSFRVLVKDVKVKKLPEATDEWAAESPSSPRSAELRADI